MITSRSKPKPDSGQHAMSSPEAMIDMHGIVKIFKNAAGEFTVLKGIDLTINRGEFVSIVGKSGSGKSTLLNMITGIDHPTSGQMIIGGTDIYTGVTESQRSRWRGRNLGIVFQFFQLLPMLTLLENVMLAMDFAEMYKFEERPARAMELLKMVGLENFATKLPVSVSTGQQQLAAIARALSCDPPLLVADEPTGNLDTKSADVIINLFDALAKSGKTVVMVTHDPSLTSRTTRNIIIADGELVDETVARSLPWLHHKHMLEVTKLMEPKTYTSGQVVVTQNTPVEHFYMIRRGEVEILSPDGQHQERLVSHLKPGEFFGAAELLNGGTSMSVVRAGANESVELLALKREDFLRVMDQSPKTVDAIRMVATQRLEQSQIVNLKSKIP